MMDDENLLLILKNSTWRQNGDFTPSSDTKKILADYWNHATSSIKGNNGVDVKDLIAEFFEKLWNLQTEQTRHYHTVVHLQEMLSYFELFFKSEHPTVHAIQEGEEKSAILLAIFFHDAIYDGKSSTNEEDSAKLFQEFAEQCGMAESLKTKVQNYIIATKTHSVCEENGVGLSLFLDLDMAVLGKFETAYLQYAALIRKEYSFVPHDTYCEKRAKVLESFIQNKIFATEVMNEVFEEQARNNIRKEIQLLRKGMVPS